MTSTRHSSKTKRKHAQCGARRWNRLSLEPLEDRIMLASDIVVGRTLSAWSVADIQDNELKITYTVYNQQASEVSGVLLTTTLQPGVTFAGASVLPDRNGQELAWSLGTLDAFGHASVEVTITFAGMVPPHLDGGAEVFGVVNTAAVSDAAIPVMLRAEAIDPALLAATPDANWNDPFIQAKAAELNQDANEIIGFMTQSIGYESYKGSLRGARGTLWSGAGNALDQASLMIGLLRASGIPAQYVSGTISDTSARELILSMFPEPFRIVGCLEPGTELADPVHDQQLLDEAHDHYWVQYEAGAGVQSADPTFPGAQPVGLAEGTFAEVPDTERHKVQIKLVVETASASLIGVATAEEIPLDLTFTSVELVGKPLSLGHFVGVEQRGTPLLSAMTRTFTPYLRMNEGGAPGQDTLLRDGSYQEFLTNFPFSSRIVTGVFLDINTFYPERAGTRQVETVRKELFDRIGFDARRSGSTVSVDVSADSEPPFTEFDVVTIAVASSKQNELALVRSGKTLAALSDEATLLFSTAQLPGVLSPTDVQDANNAVRDLLVKMTSGLAATFFLASDQVSDVLAPAGLVAEYAGSPRIVAVTGTLRFHDLGRQSTTRFAFDILKNDIRAHAFPIQAVQAEAAAQYERGFIDSFLEGDILKSLLGGDGIQTQSSLGVFLAASDQQIPSAILDQSRINLVDSLPISDEAKARIVAVLERGRFVIVPTEMVTINGQATIAWIEVDPSTGAMISVSEDGTHSSESAETVSAYQLADYEIKGLQSAAPGIASRAALNIAWKGFDLIQKGVRLGSNLTKRQRKQEIISALVKYTIRTQQQVWSLASGNLILQKIAEEFEQQLGTLLQWRIERVLRVDPPIANSLISRPPSGLFDGLGLSASGGVAVAVEPDVLSMIPFNGALVPSAFLIGVRNLAGSDESFDLSITNVPAGFRAHPSVLRVQIPAGETAEIGLCLHPTIGLPLPGTQIALDVTATSTSDPTKTRTVTVHYTVPDIHGVVLAAASPTYTAAPGSVLTADVTFASVGNVREQVTVSVETTAGLTVSGPREVSLNPGEATTLPFNFTIDPGTPLNSLLFATITGTFADGDFGTQTLFIPVRVAAPGVDALANASIAAATLGNTDLADRLDDLTIGLTNLVQTPADAIHRSQALAALDSILSLLAVDELFVAYVDPLTAARDQLAAASTPDIQAAVLALGAALDDFAVVVTNLARHNFEVDLFPNVQIAQPQVPVDYAVQVQNVGTETTTYNLAVSGLPASVTSQFSTLTLTIAPGQIAESILTLTQTSDSELLTFAFSVDVSAANVTPTISKSAIGTMQARNEHVSVPVVSATPPFGDPGTSFAIAAKILNAVNRQQDVRASFIVRDSSGQQVFASTPVMATLTVQTSVLSVNLGSLDTTGFAAGSYLVEVRLTDTNDRPIPGGTGRTTLLVGSPITAALTVSPLLLPPGTHTVTNTLQIAAVAAPSEELKLIGQFTEWLDRGSFRTINAHDVVVRGNYAYVADDIINVVWDVSDLTKPQHVPGATFGFADDFELSADGTFLVSMTGLSGGLSVRRISLANPAKPTIVSSSFPQYLLGSDLLLKGNEAYITTNLVILQGGGITEQFGDLLTLNWTVPGSPIHDVLFNDFGDTSSGDESFGIPRNGGIHNMFGMASPNANTLYVASTTSTGTNVTQDEFGNPAKGIIRIVDIADPTNLVQLGTLEIPGTMMVQGVVVDGNRAYVLGSQGAWRDPYTNPNDIGPVGNIVMAVLDISDPRNPMVMAPTTVLNRAARGMHGLSAIGSNRFVFGSLGNLNDTPQIFLIDASNPVDLTVTKQITEPAAGRNMTVDGGHLFVSTNAGVFIYSLGVPDVPVTVQVQVPNNTGVEIVPGSFNVAPTNIIEGTEFDTLVWQLTLDEIAAARSLTWQSTVTALQPGEARAVTLDTTIDFKAEGETGQIVLPPQNIFAEQILSLSPAVQIVRPAESAIYTLTIANPTSLGVTYDLAVQGVPAEWVSLAPQVTVSANSSVDIPLTLASDAFATLAEHGFVVTASVGGVSGSVMGKLTLQGDPVLPPVDPQAHGVVVSMTPGTATAGQGTSAIYTVRVTNTGSQTDMFFLSVPAIAGISTTFSQAQVEVPPGASNFREVTLIVTPASGTPIGDYPLTVAATSASRGTITDDVAGTVKVVATGVSLSFDPTRGRPGDTFTLTVTNTGQLTDTFDLTLAAPVALVATLQTNAVTLAPGEQRTVQVTVGAIDFAFPGDLPLVAIATSRTVPAVRSSALTQIAIGTHTGLDAQFDPNTTVLSNPGEASFLLLVENLGNLEGEFTASIVGTSGPVNAHLVDLEGKPATSIPLFRLPGLSSGAVLLRTNLQAAGEGTVMVQVRSRDGTHSTTAMARVSVPIVVPPPSVFIFGVSAGPQGGKVTLPAQTAEINVLPFAGFEGEVRVARGDVNHDGFIDTIYGASLSMGGHVKVIDGKTGTEMSSFLTFEQYLGGVYVGCDDVNNDGFADVIVGAGSAHLGGHVKVFDGKTGDQLASFFAFENFGGAVRVAGGDTNGDGFADIIVGAGAGHMGGHAKVFDGKTGLLLRSFFAYDNFAGGIFVAAADLNNDGKDEVITGADEGATPHVKAFSATDEALMSFLAYLPGFRGGVRVGGEDVNGDGDEEVLTANGFGAKGHVTAVGLDGLLASFFVTGEELQDGIFVA